MAVVVCEEETMSTVTIQPELSEAEKLKLWRIEKKRKMDEEKLRRRPPFITFVNVKHTGLTPYKQTPALITNKNKTNKFAFLPALKKTETTQINKQIENVKQPVPARTIAKQTKTVPIKPETTLKKLENMRITRQNANKVLPASKVPEVERKAFRIVQPSSKPTRITRSTKKTEIEPKPVIKAAVNKKDIKETKIKAAQLKEDKENVPTGKANKLVATNCKGCGKEKQRVTRARKESKPETSPKPKVEPPNGPTFQSARLEEETKKLQELKTIWLANNKENVPKDIQDEILTVTGQTTLLISSKFEQFRSLINECSNQLMANSPSNQKKITSDDLDGFWEMMFLQVVQLHNKYMKLEKLMLNNWEEPNQRRKSKAKKPIVKTPIPRKRVESRFKQFLAKQKSHENTLAGSSDGIASNQFDEDGEDEVVNLDSLKHCRVTPKAVKNLITARKSRRSSMKLIMSMSGVGKFDISGTALCASPKPEKTVTFLDMTD
ncbi:uncharacterized protein isoform X2 [Rhodnius prolixus]|uniref:uncharacterized protein isoform X2 n=1 Tax=Rhodnius prolixus TaxID=13249 RepID=UPI003D18C23D